jgi:hypothetical protein
MSIEDQLRHELKKQAETMTPPQHLKRDVQASYERYLQTKERSPMKKRLIIAATALLLLIPTVGVAADNGWLGEDVYGSFEQAKKSFKGFTKETYTGFALKLSGAKNQLSPGDYEQFIELNKKLARFQSDNGDKYGHIDADALSAADRAVLQQLYRDKAPLDDALNHLKPSTAVLSPAEFEQYVEAQIEYGTVLAKAKQSDARPFDPAKLPPDLLSRYQAAHAVLIAVSNKTYLPTTDYEQKQLQVLGEKDFATLRELRSKRTLLIDRYMPGKSALDFELLPEAVRAQAKLALAVEQTYLERAAQTQLSQDVLTPAEHDAYLEALITLENLQSRHYVYKNKAWQFDRDALTPEEEQQWEQALKTVESVKKRL